MSAKSQNLRIVEPVTIRDGLDFSCRKIINSVGEVRGGFYGTAVIL